MIWVPAFAGMKELGGGDDSVFFEGRGAFAAQIVASKTSAPGVFLRMFSIAFLAPDLEE